MILFNIFIVTVTFLLGLVAALFIGCSTYLAECDDEDHQELFVTAKVGFLIVMSVMMVLHLIGNMMT